MIAGLDQYWRTCWASPLRWLPAFKSMEQRRQGEQ